MPIRSTTTTMETNINVVRPVEVFFAGAAAGLAGLLAASEGESTCAAGAVASAKDVLAVEAAAGGAAIVAAGFKGGDERAQHGKTRHRERSHDGHELDYGQ